MASSSREDWLRSLRNDNAEQEAALADEYDDYWGAIDEDHRTFVERFLARLPANGLVLDAACGTGNYVRIVLDAGRTPVCVDHTAAYLEKVLEKAPSVRTAIHDLQELPFEAEFDGVMCVDAMEFVAPEEWPVVLEGFRRALRPGGWLYLTVELVPAAAIRAGHDAAVRRGLPLIDDGEAIWDEPDWYYHFYPAIARVRAWLRDAAFEVVEDAEGAWVYGEDVYAYHHLIVRAG
jgi:SAM-dependent methyltransferase